MLLYTMFGCIVVIQAWNVWIEFVMEANIHWMHRYQDLVPTVATMFNQMVFLEIMWACFTLEGRKQKKKTEKVD